MTLLFACVLAAAGAFLAGGRRTASASPAGNYAAAAVVMDADTGQVLSGYNIDKKLPMASTTKVLTAITVIDSMDLDTVVSVPACAVGVEGSSIYLQAGEKLTVKQLLYGLMLQSGNDCAVTLAVAAAGSVEKFADMMNAKAQEIGCKNSHFVTPHGLHDDDHYTSAGDLASITAYALKNPAFAEIVATQKVKIPFAGRDYDRVLVNKNKMLHLYPGATGVKTGFTKKAGRCLVSSASREGVNLVCVVLNCGPMWEQSMAMMDEVFAKYVSVEILPENCVLGERQVLGTQEGRTIRAYTKNAVRYTVKRGEEDKLRTEAIYTEKLFPPIAKDAEIGKFNIYYENRLIFSEKIYTMDGVEANGYRYYLKKISEGMFS